MASKHPGPASLPKVATPSSVTQTVQQPRPKLSPPSPPPQSITLKDFQDALENIYEKTIQKTAEPIEKKNDQMRVDIISALKGLAGLVEKIDDRVDEVVGKVEILQDRVDKIEDNADNVQDEILMSQYREMEFALRIRGLKENVQENLKEEIAIELASILECDPEAMLRDIEKIFRVNSWVAKQRKLPRDVVVYFARRSLRNEIIQAFYKHRFQTATQDVIILKEIPLKILRRRRDFAFLADELKKQQIQFRWDIPVGIVVTYLGLRYRLNTISKAKDFYMTVLKAESPPSPRSKKDESKAETQSDVGLKPRPGEELLVESIQLIDDPKQQRITRAAYKRREREQQQQQQQKLDDGIHFTSEPVRGARPKKSSTASLEVLFQRLQPAKNGKASNLEC